MWFNGSMLSMQAALASTQSAAPASFYGGTCLQPQCTGSEAEDQKLRSFLVAVSLRLACDTKGMRD